MGVSFAEDLESYFLNLNATSEICSNFGTTFTSNSNLFLFVEPASPTNSITIIPYPGIPPDTRHKDAQYPSVQIRIKNTSVPTAYKVTKAVINTLHNNDRVGSNIIMKLFANQSEPLFLKYDAEDYPVFVANFDAMIIKYTVS
jgi:hypothetical protein